jgi:Fe-S-cluster containining protein
MAAELGLSEAEFLEQYTHETSLGRSLHERETAHGFDCVFLDRQQVPGKAVCGVYGSRPTQCRTWPFWPSIVRSRQAWERAGQTCPGLNQGPLFSPAVIRLTVERQREAGSSGGDPARD